MQVLTMTECTEKVRFVGEIVHFVETHPYEPEACARYVYVKSLDERAYRYTDEKLNRLLDVIGGMSAGEEFFYSRDEVLEMLRSYLADLEA